MAPLLVATDLDGTLLHSDGTASARTVAALRAAEDAGAVVVLVTGRPPRWMRPVAEAVGHTGLAICANGAVVYDLHTEAIVESFPLDREAAMAVVDVVRDAIPGVAFAVETAEHGFGHEAAYSTRFDEAANPPRIGAIESLLDHPPVKLLIRHEEMDPDSLLAAARKVAEGLAELTHSSINGLLEVSATGITKATTLARVAEQHGVSPDDVVAFGDMPNDLPMLAWAGTAYGMRNAHPDVVAAVDRLAPTNDEDGVAQVLERLFV
jgi:Cof subfamily protein (haloacid dehalogenase superfamily)